jgi:hypothetical protein
MKPDRLGIKFYINTPTTIDLATIVPIFQRWIQDHAVEGMLIDVIDYKHVHEGPGIVLIGHEGDYGLDLGDGRHGLLYIRKRDGGDTLKEQLQIAIRFALGACRQLEAEPSLQGLTFNYSEAKISFMDRLHTPNTPETFDTVHDQVQSFLTEIYGGDVELQRAYDDARELFAIRVNAAKDVTLDTMLERLTTDQTVTV